MSKISREKKRKKLEKNPHLVKKELCESCGEEFPIKQLIRGPDPFYSEIYRDNTPTVLCKECHHQSCWSI